MKPPHYRYGLLGKQLAALEEREGGIDQFTRAYETFGVQRRHDNSLVFFEWAPAAEALFLAGDFSEWSFSQHALQRTHTHAQAGAKLKLRRLVFCMKVVIIDEETDAPFNPEGKFVRSTDLKWVL